MSTRIALDGVGGQGVRVIAGVMGALLARMGKEVTVLFDYDSSVRGSMSDANGICSAASTSARSCSAT